MSWTLEEQVGAELDTLWQAALFLEGGRETRAEALLSRAVAAAADDVLGVDMDSGHADLVERFMVRRFFEDAGTSWAPGSDPDRRSASAPSGLNVATLLREAGEVPEGPRAALWLVLVRRRSYEESAAILGIERAELAKLLTYRELLLARLAGRASRMWGDAPGDAVEEESVS